MTCLEAQNLITPFINDQLDIPTLEDFINHINHCDDCREELEVYYTLLTGMKQLDDDKNLSGDFHVDFVNKLRKAEERIKRKKIHNIRKRVSLLVTIVIIGVISGLGIKEYVVDEFINENSSNEDQYVPLKYYFYRGKTTNLDEYMKEHYKDILEQNVGKEMNFQIDIKNYKEGK